MTNEQDLIASQNLNTAVSSNVVPITRAKSFDIGIDPNSPNYQQYVTTVNAYAVALEMTFEDIAKAGEELGDKVVRGEVDAPIKSGLENKVSEVIEKEGRIIAWQNRGEVISLTPQIAITSSFQGTELVQSQTTGAQSINVIEGISVSLPQQPSLIDTRPSNVVDISQNPYLMAPAILKTAA